jgi:hypothetical protein
MGLELKVAAVDPLKFLLSDGNIVEHGLYVAWLRQHVVVDLVEECWDADVLRHSLGFVRANPMLVRNTMSCSRPSAIW